MADLPLVILVIAVFVFLFVGIGIKDIVQVRRIVRTRHEWLFVLSPKKWRRGYQIAGNMSARKKAKAGGAVMYMDLSTLEDDGLIESREVSKRINGHRIIREIKETQYKLTDAGFKFRRGPMVN